MRRKGLITIASAAVAAMAMTSNAGAANNDLANALLDTVTTNTLAVSVYVAGSAPGVTCQPPTPVATQVTPYQQVAIGAVFQTDVAEGNLECVSLETGFRETLR